MFIFTAVVQTEQVSGQLLSAPFSKELASTYPIIERCNNYQHDKKERNRKQKKTRKSSE